jgi:hypothetical protein
MASVRHVGRVRDWLADEDDGDFGAEVAAILAGLTGRDLVGPTLTLPLAVSTALQRHRVSPAQAIPLLLELRRRLLDCSGLDRRAEPRPLLVGEDRTTVVNLSVYLYGLLCRASQAAGCSRADMAETVAERVA